MIRAVRNFMNLPSLAKVSLVSLLSLGWILVAPSIAGAQPATTQPAPSEEYQIKAAYILNFVQYIDWPQATFSAADTPFTIGVLGDDPFGPALEQTFQDETIAGRKLVVKRSTKIEDLQSCHLLFISKSEKDHIPEILASLKDKSIVTVSELDQFAQRGGIVNFYLNNNKIRFEINANAAEKISLKIHSQLLKRAKIVNSD